MANRSIYKSVNKKTGEELALKVIQLDSLLASRKFREFKTQMLLDHAGIIKYYNIYEWSVYDEDTFSSNHFLVLSMEICQTNLEKTIVEMRSKQRYPTYNDIVKLLKTSVNVCEYLKKEKKTYLFNIKPNNILIKNGE